MDLMEGLLTRRSVRLYDPNQKVDSVQMGKILNAAMHAPSAMNKQPWHFIVVDKPELLEKITEIHPYARFVKEAGTAIIVCADTDVAYSECGPTDAIIAAENILLAAHGLGLGTCWCGIYPHAEREADFTTVFHLPKHIIPIALIAVGYPAEMPKQPTNRYQADKIHTNLWD